jgi:hypothetical protein
MDWITDHVVILQFSFDCKQVRDWESHELFTEEQSKMYVCVCVGGGTLLAMPAVLRLQVRMV